MNPHPSFLALDQLAVGDGNAEVRAHVAGCSLCNAYVEAMQPETSVPAWAQRPQRGMNVTRMWLSIGAGALVGGLAVALVLMPRIEHAQRDWLAEKGGGPGLMLYVKRGDEVRAWDGHSPVQAGDSLRLQVAPDGYQHVTVEAAGAQLFDGDVPNTTSLLPVSWRVDKSVTDEVLDITLSGGRSPSWRTQLVLPRSST